MIAVGKKNMLLNGLKKERRQILPAKKKESEVLDF